MRSACLWAAVILGSCTTMSTALADPPKVGDAPPDIRLQATSIKSALPDATGDTLSLADFKGKKNVVLFFFPKALTGG